MSKPLRIKIVAAATMSLVGISIFAVVLSSDLKSVLATGDAEVPRGLIARYVVAMAAGGAVAGFILSGLFGRGGVLGWLMAAIGGVLAALFSGLFGSLFGLLPDLLSDGWQTGDLIAVVSGALLVPFALNDWPPLIAVWLALVGVAHLWIRRLRD